MTALQGVDYSIMGMRYTTSLISYLADMIIPFQYQASVSSVMSLIANGQATSLTQQMLYMCDMVSCCHFCEDLA